MNRTLEQIIEQGDKLLNVTAFFRFEELYERLFPIIQRDKNISMKKEIKYLSIGCSIGAEVYSFNYYFRKRGFRTRSYGIDILPENIFIAERGVYLVKTEFLNKYPSLFQEIKDDYSIKNFFRSLKQKITYKDYHNVEIYTILNSYNNFKFLREKSPKKLVKINRDYKNNTLFYIDDAVKFLEKMIRRREYFDVIQYTLVDVYLSKTKKRYVLDMLSKTGKYILVADIEPPKELKDKFCVLKTQRHNYIYISKEKINEQGFA